MGCVGCVRKWEAAQNLLEPPSPDGGEELASQAEQGGKQCEQREEHRITLDTKISLDCISPLLLVHQQLIHIRRLEKPKKRAVLRQLKPQPFV